jgi:hypothetical protein
MTRTCPGTRIARFGAARFGAALVVGLLAAAPFGSGARAGAVTAGNTRFVPATVPAGWYLWGATAPSAHERASGGSTYYARRDDPGSGPALAVGTMARDGFTGLRATTPGASAPRTVDGLPGGRLARSGPYAWVTWLAPGGTDVRLVAARGLADDAVVAAAKSARFTTHGPVAIDGDVLSDGTLPDGMTRLVSDAGIGPDGTYPAQDVVLVDATGQARVDLSVFRGNAAERAFVRFWADQVPRRGSDAGAAGHAVVAERDGRTVVARGDAPATVLRALVRDTAPTDTAGWQAFRAQVAQLPVAAFFPQAALATGAVLDGASDGTRWAVGWDRGTASPHAWNMLLTADGTQGGGGTGLPDSGLPDVASSGTILGHGGMLFAGVVPAATATARFEPPGRAPVTATLGPLTPDGAHRYFAAWVPGLDGTAPVVVFDAAGNEIARRAQFGCNTCG